LAVVASVLALADRWGCRKSLLGWTCIENAIWFDDARRTPSTDGVDGDHSHRPAGGSRLLTGIHSLSGAAHDCVTRFGVVELAIPMVSAAVF
jgi:hypothetical protein